MVEPVTREEFNALVEKLDEQMVVTRQVHDILATFKTLYTVAKWVTAMGAAAVVVFKGGEWAAQWIRR